MPRLVSVRLERRGSSFEGMIGGQLTKAAPHVARAETVEPLYRHELVASQVSPRFLCTHYMLRGTGEDCSFFY